MTVLHSAFMLIGEGSVEPLLRAVLHSSSVDAQGNHNHEMTAKALAGVARVASARSSCPSTARAAA